MINYNRLRYEIKGIWLNFLRSYQGLKNPAGKNSCCKAFGILEATSSILSEIAVPERKHLSKDIDGFPRNLNSFKGREAVMIIISICERNIKEDYAVIICLTVRIRQAAAEKMEPFHVYRGREHGDGKRGLPNGEARGPIQRGEDAAAF